MLRVKATRTAGVVWLALACGRVGDDRVAEGHATEDASPRDAEAGVDVNTGGSGGAMSRRDAAVAETGGSPFVDAGTPDAESRDAADVAPSPDAAHADAASADAGVLRHYDVWLDAPTMSGCAPAIGHSRLNLSFYDGDPPRAYYFEDFVWYAADAEVARNGSVLEIAPTDRFEEQRPRLYLDEDGGELAGTGYAVTLLECADGIPREETLGVRVAADITPPRVRARASPEIDLTFPFSWFWFMISEPANLDDTSIGAVTYPFNTVESTEGRVTLVEDGTGLPLPVEIRQWPFGPAAAAVFSDRDLVSGRVARVGLSAELYDSAGNRAVADDTLLPIHDAGPAVAEHDFDLGAQGTVAVPIGDVTLHEPAAPATPCEAGGCLELRNRTDSCSPPDDATASALALRLAMAPGDAIEMRYRIWTSSPITVPSIRIVDGGCTVLLPQAPFPTPLAAPDGAYTHATEWLTDTFTTCLGLTPDTGLLLDLCTDPAPDDFQARVVVEWIRAVPAQ